MIGEYNNEKKLIPKKGSIFKNRVLHYLAPSLKLYGDEFIFKYKTLACMATGIGNGELDSKNIYSIFDVNGKSKYDTYLDKREGRVHFTYILNWLKDQPYYVKDYPFDSGMRGYQHMIVLKIPENVNTDAFLQGSYSNIYDKGTLDKIYPDQIALPNNKKIRNVTKLILSKSEKYKEDFLEKTNLEFGTNLSVKDVDNTFELDFPPLLINEVFNYGNIQ